MLKYPESSNCREHCSGTHPLPDITAFCCGRERQFKARRSDPTGVIRTFSGNCDVVDVTFPQAGGGDPDEFRLLVEFGQVSGADISHCGAQAARELMHDVTDRPLIGHLSLYPFRHQLERVFDVLLEIAVGRAAPPRPNRPNPAISFVRAALP